MPTPTDVLRVIRSFVANSASELFIPGRSQGYIKDWLTTNYRFVDRYPGIPRLKISDIFPEVSNIVVPMEVSYNYWNISPLELYLMSCLAIFFKPRRIFEIGTYDGATTLQLAKCCPDSHIYTLDLPPQPGSHFQVGSRFINSPYETQITQLLCDSTNFDYSPYSKQIDFVFVDGAHEYEIVKSDSMNALKMVSPGGIIVWDDYLNYRGVKRAVEELASKYPVVHLVDTKFALLINTER